MKKCNMEKVQHENSRGVGTTSRTSKIENFATMFNGFDSYFCKFSIVDGCRDADYTSGNSAT